MVEAVFEWTDDHPWSNVKIPVFSESFDKYLAYKHCFYRP